jgi:hypothetical protein
MIYLIDERRKISDLAKIARLNDQLVFENRNLHDFLFNHIRWTDLEAAATRDGLDLKTLELNPFDRIGFKLLRSWPLVEKLNSIGLSKMASKQAEKLALSASAVGLVTVKGDAREDLIRCGRAMQRVWLEATRLSLSFQLMTGITFLMGRVRQGAIDELVPKHVEIIKNAEESLKNIYSLEAEVPAVLFRLGRSPGPSARSLRLPLETVIK